MSSIPLRVDTAAVSRPDFPRVLSVDDAGVARAVIARAIEASGRFIVAGNVGSADAALRFLRQERVDALILDIEMPGVSGLADLPDLIAAGLGAKVLIVSSSCGEGATATIEALALGAADTLVKPEAGGFTGGFSQAISEKLLRLFEIAPTDVTVMPSNAGQAATSFDIVAIGASPGGLHALSLMLRELPAGFPLPILVTQHLPATNMPNNAAQMSV